MSEPLVPRTPRLPAIIGVTAPVDRRLYALVGVSLMVLKYAVEALAVWLLLGTFLHPLIFLSPVISFRLEMLPAELEWVTGLWALWTLPFIWIGASMTVRRARDAGLSPWVGLVFFMPIINLLAMVGLATLPSKPAEAAPQLPLSGDDRLVWSALIGVGSGSALALGMVLLSVFVLGEYGGTLFVGTPFVMGAVSAYFLNLGGERSTLANIIVGVATVAVAGGLLTLFALEGAICLAMAAPIAVALSLMGVFLGRALAAMRKHRAVGFPVFALPLVAVLEPAPGGVQLHEVLSVIEIDAPAEVVWDAVVGFGEVDLAPPAEWFFQLGIAYPQRARIEGEGVDAVRYCEFSTGPFVEPITVWDAPHRLAFSVSESPPTMHEWSPYQHVNAPHLDTVLKSRRGEFLLTELPDGGTRLEARTWYTFEMAPEAYWSIWSDLAIHAIHTRVLAHIREVAELPGG